MSTQDKVKNELGSVMKGGGIVTKKDGDQISILLLYRGNHDDWQFPKGHNEPGESIDQTVLREVKEEAGIDVAIIKELTPNTYVNTKTGEETVCYMYLLKPVTGEIKPEHEGDKVEWIPIAEVPTKLSYQNLVDYFNQVREEVIQSI